jgi:hypothetical protein
MRVEGQMQIRRQRDDYAARRLCHRRTPEKLIDRITLWVCDSSAQMSVQSPKLNEQSATNRIEPGLVMNPRWNLQSVAMFIQIRPWSTLNRFGPQISKKTVNRLFRAGE